LRQIWFRPRLGRARFPWMLTMTVAGGRTSSLMVLELCIMGLDSRRARLDRYSVMVGKATMKRMSARFGRRLGRRPVEGRRGENFVRDPTAVDEGSRPAATSTFPSTPQQTPSRTRWKRAVGVREWLHPMAPAQNRRRAQVDRRGRREAPAAHPQNGDPKLHSTPDTGGCARTGQLLSALLLRTLRATEYVYLIFDST